MKKRMEFLRFFLRGLASMLNSGVPILRCLYSLHAQQTELWARDLIERIIVRVSTGETFSDSLKKEPKFFPRFIVSLIYLGEETACLQDNLEKAADFVERSANFKTKIQSALTYPLFLMGVMIFGVIVLLKYFLPAFYPVLDGTDFELPVSTRFLLKTAALFSSVWFWLVALCLASAVVYFYGFIRRDHQRKYRLDSFLLALPGAGKVLKSGLFAQLTRTLATAHSAGVSLSRGLALLEDVAENEVFRRFIQDARLAIVNGRELSEFFLGEKSFAPPLVGHLLSVGEKTGKIAALLPKCTRLLEDETEYFLSQFFKFLEPGILAVMGVLVIWVMLSILSPLYGGLAAIR